MSRKRSARAAARKRQPVLEDEEKVFRRALESNEQVATGDGPLPPGATHVVETAPDGTRRLRRKRFSAV